VIIENGIEECLTVVERTDVVGTTVAPDQFMLVIFPMISAGKKFVSCAKNLERFILSHLELVDLGS